MDRTQLITWLSPQPPAAQVPCAFEPGAPHPLAIAAANQVLESLRAGWVSPGLSSEVLQGRDGEKMFGVLVVRAADGRIGFLRAFSGQLDGTWDVEGYAPPVFDRARRELTEPRGEAAVRRFTARVLALESSIQWAGLREEKAALAGRHAEEDRALGARLQALRARRHDGSGAATTTGRDDETEHRREKKRMREERAPLDAALAAFERRLRRVKQLRVAASRISSRQLYDTYLFANSRGESRTLWELCAPRAPPSGTGDCAAPKLIVHALRHGLEPLALAELWFGKPPRSGGKIEGSFYPPCSEKCGLVLPFLLSGGGFDSASWASPARRGSGRKVAAPVNLRPHTNEGRLLDPMPEILPESSEPASPELIAEPAPAPDDGQLVRRMASGDRTALAALYDRYAGLMLGLGIRMLCERRDAEDLVQDVLLEAWNKAAGYEEARGSVRTWLFLRMRSRCLDRLKARKQLRESQAAMEAVRPEELACDDAPRSSLDAEPLQRALDDLPVEQRLVLELSYFRGLSGSEIARLIGVPLATVKSRVAYALRKLRQALGAPDPRAKDQRRSA